MGRTTIPREVGRTPHPGCQRGNKKRLVKLSERISKNHFSRQRAQGEPRQEAHLLFLQRLASVTGQEVFWNHSWHQSLNSKEIWTWRCFLDPHHFALQPPPPPSSGPPSPLTWVSAVSCLSSSPPFSRPQHFLDKVGRVFFLKLRLAHVSLYFLALQ